MSLEKGDMESEIFWRLSRSPFRRSSTKAVERDVLNLIVDYSGCSIEDLSEYTEFSDYLDSEDVEEIVNELGRRYKFKPNREDWREFSIVKELVDYVEEYRSD